MRIHTDKPHWPTPTKKGKMVEHDEVERERACNLYNDPDLRPSRPFKMTFKEFAAKVKPEFKLDDVVVSVMQQLSTDSDWGWFHVLLPPRKGKTTLAELFAAYELYTKPGIAIGYATYNQEAAVRPTIRCQDHYLATGRHSTKLKPREFTTEDGGTFRSFGVGEVPCGWGADLLIVDDPFKNFDDVKNFRKVQKWFQQTWVPRLRQGGRQLIIQTQFEDEGEFLYGKVYWPLVDLDDRNWLPDRF
jgi:hypothetical protein